MHLVGKRDFRQKEGHRTQKSDLLNVGFSHSCDDPCDDAQDEGGLVMVILLPYHSFDFVEGGGWAR